VIKLVPQKRIPEVVSNARKFSDVIIYDAIRAFYSLRRWFLTSSANVMRCRALPRRLPQGY